MTTETTGLAERLQVTEVELQAFVNQIRYRKQYNAKPEVRVKRREYNKARGERMKQVREAVARMGEEERAKYGL